MSTTFKGKLHEMVMTTPTRYWNDSCSVEELTYAIERGATGATSNPTIVLGVLKKEMHLWEEHIINTIKDNPYLVRNRDRMEDLRGCHREWVQAIAASFQRGRRKEGTIIDSNQSCFLS